MTHDESNPRTDASTDEYELDRQDSLAFERRDYLRSLGGIGAAGLLGSTAASSTATAQSADWEAAADQRIDQHRKSDVEVVARDSDGNPVSDAEVSIEMQDHEFGFGTAVNAGTLQNSSEGDPYREHIPKLFNKAVLENGHKWKFWEDNQSRADWATQWLVDQGLDMRGHVCIWGDPDVGAIPSDVQNELNSNNPDTQFIRDRSMQHIEDIISHYGDDIEEWDVVNEMLHKHTLVQAFYGDKINTDEPWTGEVVPWTSPILGDWYEKAAQVADQEGVRIAVNDFNTLRYGYTRDWYPQQIDYLVNERGIDLDGIGHQAHMAATTGEVGSNSSPDGRMTYDQINTVLDIYADYDADQKITEFDMYGGSDWNGQEERAEVLRTFLKTSFSHPSVSDFLLWGFWDGRHWKNEAALFEQDWSKKPAYDVWTGLIFDEWWTSESGTTDGQGTYATDAFLGEHEITVSTSEGEMTETVSVTDASNTTTVEVTVDGGGGSTPDPNGEEIEGKVPQDTDGDGLHEDFNANGRLDSDDVVTFFEHKDDAAVTDHVSKYDFNGNDRIDYDDIVSLFKSL